jgi:predicted lactoylglutathione lyase
MTAAKTRKLFVNIPVRDLKRSVDFFTRLGFTFNPQFTDDKATCMIVSDEAFFMLLVDDRFKDFTTKQICDTSSHQEALFALSTASRAEVDQILETVIAGGGREAGEAKDHGFMYYRAFYDLDGHHWEVLFMEPSHVQS